MAQSEVVSHALFDGAPVGMAELLVEDATEVVPDESPAIPVFVVMAETVVIILPDWLVDDVRPVHVPGRIPILRSRSTRLPRASTQTPRSIALQSLDRLHGNTELEAAADELD